MRDSMWSSNVCNALNSWYEISCVVANFKHINYRRFSLRGSSSLSDCKQNEESERKRQERWNGEREFCSTSTLQNRREKTRRNLNSEMRGKWCRAETLGVMSLNLL